MEHVFDIAIIGAGFSGCSLAYSLAQFDSDTSVVVFDQNDIASGASGNPRAHLIPYITSPHFPGHTFYNEGFSYSARLLKELNCLDLLPSLHCTPAIQCKTNDRPARILEGLSKKNSTHNTELRLLNEREALGMLGSTLGVNASPLCTELGVYPETYVVDPRELCKVLLKASGDATKVRAHTVVKEIRYNNQDNTFSIITSKDHAVCSAVVVTAGHESIAFSDLPIKPLRGQIVMGTPYSPLLEIKVPLCFNGYYLPPIEGDSRALLGTTYDRGELSPFPHHEKNEEMLQRLRALPLLGPATISSQSNSEFFAFSEARVSFRAVTKDRFPVIGRLPTPLQYSHQGLFINAGHGSRGLHSGPLGSLLLTKLLLKKNLTTQDQQFLTLLDPLRFSADYS